MDGIGKHLCSCADFAINTLVCGVIFCLCKCWFGQDIINSKSWRLFRAEWDIDWLDKQHMDPEGSKFQFKFMAILNPSTFPPRSVKDEEKLVQTDK